MLGTKYRFSIYKEQTVPLTIALGRLQSWFCLLVATESLAAAQAGLELETTLLPRPPKTEVDNTARTQQRPYLASGDMKLGETLN